MEDGLGPVARMIRVGIADDLSNDGLATHVSVLKRSGAEILVFAGVPEHAAKVIRLAASLDWRPVVIMNQMASSIADGLKLAGLENSVGVTTAAYLKDAGDPAWKDERSSADWQAFLANYRRAGGKGSDSAAMFGYAAAETLVKVLENCGNDLSRENVMKHAAALKDYQGSALLPGIKISTGPWSFRPIKHMRLVQFDGHTWRPIGEVLETAFSGSDK
jgi:branched-chain amino acid transport system substrate-binding protein